MTETTSGDRWPRYDSRHCFLLKASSLRRDSSVEKLRWKFITLMVFQTLMQLSFPWRFFKEIISVINEFITRLGCSSMSYVERPYFSPLCVCVVRYISLCKHWCGRYIPQWGLCFITLTGWTRMFMCGQWVSHLVLGGKQGYRSTFPWLDLDTHLVICNKDVLALKGYMDCLWSTHN